MRPNFASIMCFCVARVMRNEPRRWTFMTASQSSALILKSMLSRMMPALLTSTVGAPSSAATRSTAACTAGLVGHVDTDGEALAAGGLDLGHHCGAGGLVEVEDGDGIPVGGEALGDGGADAARGPGDDGGALGRRVGGGRLVGHAFSWVEVVEVWIWWSSFCWSRFMPASQASGWAARCA